MEVEALESIYMDEFKSVFVCLCLLARAGLLLLYMAAY